MELLEYLYRQNSKSFTRHMANFANIIAEYCEKKNALVERDSLGNIYVTKGNGRTYPCLCAHLDEVHGIRPKYFDVITSSGIIYGFDTESKTPFGIGADDKNGIWIALKCLERYNNIKIAFFVNEEYGDVGSNEANMEFFEDCRFVIECDRNSNHSDFVTTIWGKHLCSKEFVKACNLKKFGYSVSIGGLTDVYALAKRGLKVSSCNISCGYHNPHTPREYTNISELYNCLYFVRSIIENCKKKYPR